MEKKDGILFLEEVKEKIEARIEELSLVIEEGRKDIASMQEYYWENYTEMDEYGYENYDNQQALLRQASANNDKTELLHRFQKMKDSPFFGRVDFLYEGEDEAETFYIGIGNFAEKAGSVPLIYDWRAPVSGLFYDFDIGPASYEAPAGLIAGVIEAKWQYKIRGGKMIYGFESDMMIDDEILKQELGSNSDVRLKNIVRTIQKEQNAVIRNTKDKILVIQGAAGSGKTSIALHRIAYLLYHDRKNLKSSNVLILSPNSVFADYISHILPELGEENIQEMSFDIFAYKELKKTAADCEDRFHQIERQIERRDPAEEKRSREKQSEYFVGLVEGFLAELEDRLMDIRDIEFKGMQKSEQEIITLFYCKFQHVPLLARMHAVMEYFVDEYETLYQKEISEEERELLEEQFMKMYVTRDLYEIYNWLMEEAGYLCLPGVPYEKRMLAYEDVYPMLYLKHRLDGTKARKNIKHLVIDEMQDYSYLQYVILEGMFSCKMTILGDKAQTIDHESRDVMKFLPKIFGKNTRKIIMNKSYRNTVEIARYAGKTAGVNDIDLFERHGKEVTEEKLSSFDEAVQHVKENLHIAEEEFETAAVITMTEWEAKVIYRKLKETGVQVSYIDRDSTTFRKGLSVLTFYMAKGLEFDQVFGVSEMWGTEFAGQAKYICATRALHELYMYDIK